MIALKLRTRSLSCPKGRLRSPDWRSRLRAAAQRPHERLALLRDWVPSMDKDYLTLKHAPIGPNEEDYDVLFDGVLSAASSYRQPRPATVSGCGQSTTETARRPAATRRRERLRWWRSPRAGRGSVGHAGTLPPRLV